MERPDKHLRRVGKPQPAEVFERLRMVFPAIQSPLPAKMVHLLAQLHDHKPGAAPRAVSGSCQTQDKRR